MILRVDPGWQRREGENEKNILKFSSLALCSPENDQAKGISDKKNKKNRRNSLSNFELLRLVFVLGLCWDLFMQESSSVDGWCSQTLMVKSGLSTIQFSNELNFQPSWQHEVRSPSWDRSLCCIYFWHFDLDTSASVAFAQLHVETNGNWCWDGIHGDHRRVKALSV